MPAFTKREPIAIRATSGIADMPIGFLVPLTYELVDEHVRAAADHHHIDCQLEIGGAVMIWIEAWVSKSANLQRIQPPSIGITLSVNVEAAIALALMFRLEEEFVKR